MSSKEKKGFKRISKKFLSSFRKDKKLQDISELHDDTSVSLADVSQADVSFHVKPEHGNSRLAGKESKDRDRTRQEALTLSPHKSSKSHFKRILNRASFSNVRSIAKEHPDLLRNITSPRAGQRELGGSRSASTDSGIDCSVILSERSTPEKFVTFSRRESERLRQEFVNESTLETVTEVDSRSSIEDEIDEHDKSNCAGYAENVANESLEEQINQTKEQIEVLTELKTVLSGKLKEIDPTCSASPQLDDENYVVMTPPSANTTRTRSNNQARNFVEDSHNDSYFVDLFSNKTDEIKVEETRIRNGGDLEHEIVNPIPMQAANIASHKTLPSTPAPASLFNNENSAFAKKRSVKRSVSDVSKGLFGKLRSKKKDSSSSLTSKDDCATTDSRKKNNQIKSKSLKKNRSFSFDGEHDESVDYLDNSINFESLDNHISIVEDIDSINPIVEGGNLSTRISPIGQEAVGAISELTEGLSEMTSALCASQGHSAESIACICDCKNKDSNTDLCEKHRNSPVEDPNEIKTIKTTLPETGAKTESDVVKNKVQIEKSTSKSKPNYPKERSQVKSESVEFDRKLSAKREKEKSIKDQKKALSRNQHAGKTATKMFDQDLLNKSIKNIADKEATYVNLVKRPVEKKKVKDINTERFTKAKVGFSKPSSNDVLGDSCSDSEDSDCDCCEWCSQGCDCSHSDSECSDPNCAECLSELSRRSRYGNVSSSCDSLSENDGGAESLDKTIIEPYPNWVNTSDEGSSGSQSSPKVQLSVLNKSTTDDNSPEPMRITKFDSSPNSINSFNMDSSFSVSFREVDFENGEVMYKLDSSLNESLLSSTSERQESPNVRNPQITKLQSQSFSHTPAPSPNVANNGHQRTWNDELQHNKTIQQKKESQGVQNKMNCSLPMNLSFHKDYGENQSLRNCSFVAGNSESPLNFSQRERNIAAENNFYPSENRYYSSKMVNRGYRKERPSSSRAKYSSNSLLSRSLNEYQFLQDYETSRGHYSKYRNLEPSQFGNDIDNRKSVSFNHSLNESMMYPEQRDRYPEMLRQPPGLSRGQMSRSFTDGMNLNQSSLDSSFFMDSRQNRISNSPLDLSISKPRHVNHEMSPKPLDLSMSTRVTSPVNSMSKQARWVNRHVGQIYSPAKRVLHKNQGLSEKDLCKQILDLYVSDADETFYEPEPDLDTTMDSSVMMGPPTRFNAEDSMLQYGTYLAPRHVSKETNVDDFTTTVRTCYTGEARTRRLPADSHETKHERSRHRSDGSRRSRSGSDRHKGSRSQDRSRGGSNPRTVEKSRDTQTILNQSAEHIYEEIPSFLGQRPVLKDRTNTLKKKSSLKKSPLVRQEELEGEKKKKKDVKELSEKSFDRLTLLHTAHNGQRKVKCLSMDESIHVVKHYPPPKEASRISWGQTLSELELWRHTPRKSPVKTNSILTQKENTYPYEDDTPSPIVLTKMRKPKTFNQKYKNWPWS